MNPIISTENNLNQILVRKHLYMILLLLTIIVVSFFLAIDCNEVIHFSLSNHYSILGICLFKEIFNVDCPTCGLTRSFIAIGHLQFNKAWHYNRVGMFIYLYLLLQILYHLSFFIKKGKYFKSYNHNVMFKAINYFILVLLISNWIYNRLVV